MLQLSALSTPSTAADGPTNNLHHPTTVAPRTPTTRRDTAIQGADTTPQCILRPRATPPLGNSPHMPRPAIRRTATTTTTNRITPTIPSSIHDPRFPTSPPSFTPPFTPLAPPLVAAAIPTYFDSASSQATRFKSRAPLVSIVVYHRKLSSILLSTSTETLKQLPLVATTLVPSSTPCKTRTSRIPKREAR